MRSVAGYNLHDQEMTDNEKQDHKHASKPVVCRPTIIKNIVSTTLSWMLPNQ
jgi:hypothetical protein